MNLLVSKLGHSLGEIQNWHPYTEGKVRQKKEAGHSTWVGGNFNKQEKLSRRLVSGSHRTSRSPHPPTRIWKVYVEGLMGFDHRYNPEDLNNTLLSQGCVLSNSSTYGNSGQNRHWKGRAGSEASSGPVQGWIRGHIFSMTNPTDSQLNGFDLMIQCDWAPFIHFHLSLYY